MSFYTKGLLNDLQPIASKTVLFFPSQLGVLKDTFERVLQATFQTVFQTFLVTVADHFNVIHFALFLLFFLRKLCTMLQFHFFQKKNLQLSWSGVLVSLATQILSELPPKSSYTAIILGVFSPSRPRCSMSSCLVKLFILFGFLNNYFYVALPSSTSLDALKSLNV